MARKRQDGVLVHPALDDGVDLDRREPGRMRRFDAVEHARDGKIDVVHCAECRVVERIETDGDTRKSRCTQRTRFFSKQCAVRGQREINAGQRGELLDQTLDVFP